MPLVSGHWFLRLLSMLGSEIMSKQFGYKTLRDHEEKESNRSRYSLDPDSHGPATHSQISPLGFAKGQDFGPPEHVVVLEEFLHPCEDDIVCKCTTEENKVPYFNAPVYLENKEQIGKVDEIFGQLRDFYFSVKLSENMKASSFKKLQKFYIDPYKLLPLQRFLPPPPGEKGPSRGGGRGGRGGGGFRGGRGGGGFRGGLGGGGFRGRGHSRLPGWLQYSLLWIGNSFPGQVLKSHL
ncbi:H/ACA ribonucleoprotein complex subunit 1-like [Sorex araneus]|uniref:H/ACA ribonucleoprotein complex subunit 1-like n=1 Tax=Sorex araneus TaxID=42254 RepID=UPI0024337ACE|nr:H/ACA ribonucleoprotein complex subunit 1-like [Sorex araneus]